RVKPAPDANVRSETHTASPNREHPARQFLGGTNLSNRRMRTRMYGGVAGEERRLSPLCRLQTHSVDGQSDGDVREISLQLREVEAFGEAGFGRFGRQDRVGFIDAFIPPVPGSLLRASPGQHGHAVLVVSCGIDGVAMVG